MAQSILEQVRSAIEASTAGRSPVEVQPANTFLARFQKAPEAWHVLLQLMHEEAGQAQFCAMTLFFLKLRQENIAAQDAEVQHGVVSALDDLLGQMIDGSRPDIAESALHFDKLANIMAICAAQRGKEAAEAYVSSLLQLASTAGLEGGEHRVRTAIQLLQRLACIKTQQSPLTAFLPVVLAMLEFAALGQQLDEGTCAQLAVQPFPVEWIASARTTALAPIAFWCTRDLPHAGARLHMLQAGRPGLLVAMLAHIADPIDTSPALPSSSSSSLSDAVQGQGVGMGVGVGVGGGGAPAGLSLTSTASSGSLSSLGMPSGLSSVRRAKAVLRPGFVASCDALCDHESFLHWADLDLRTTRAGAGRREYLAAMAEGDQYGQVGARLSGEDLDATLNGLRSIQHAVCLGFHSLQCLRDGQLPEGKSMAVQRSDKWGYLNAVVWKDAMEKFAELTATLVRVAPASVCAPSSPDVDRMFCDVLVRCAHTGTHIAILRNACDAAVKMALVPAAKRSEHYRHAFFTRMASALFDSCRYPTAFPATANWQLWASSRESEAYNFDERDWDDGRRHSFAAAMDACFNILGQEFLQLLIEACPLSGAAPPAYHDDDDDDQGGSATPKAGRQWEALDPAAPGAWQRMELLLYVLHSIHSPLIARLRTIDKVCMLQGADPCGVPPQAVETAPAAIQEKITEAAAITQLLRQVFSIVANAAPIIQASPLVAHAGCRLIGAYAPWLLTAQGNGDLPGQCLEYVARAMATKATSLAAASALASLVARASKHIAGHPDLPRHLVGSYAAAYPHLPMDARRSAGSALVRVACELPDFADAAGMIMAVARPTLDELQTALNNAKVKAAAKAAGGRTAESRSALRNGTEQRIMQEIAWPLEVLAELARLAVKMPPEGHPAVVLSPDTPAVTAQHAALMILEAAGPVLQDMLSPASFTGGTQDIAVPGTRSYMTVPETTGLTGFLKDIVYTAAAGFLVSVGRAVASSPEVAPRAYALLLSLLRSSFRNTTEPSFLLAIGDLARDAGTVLGRLLEDAERTASSSVPPLAMDVVLASSPAAPVFAAFTSTAREVALLCCHLFLRSAYGTRTEAVSTDVSAARSPPPFFSRMWHDGGGFDCGMQLSAAYNMLAAMACTVPLALLDEGVDDEAAQAAAESIRQRLTQEEVSMVQNGFSSSLSFGLEGGQRGEGHAGAGAGAEAVPTLDSIEAAAGAHAQALVEAYNAPLPQLLGLLLDHGLSMISELDRIEKPCVLGLMSSLHRLRYGLSARLAAAHGGAASGGLPSAGEVSASASTSAAAASAFADDALGNLAAGEDLNGRGASAAHALIAPMPVKSLPLSVAESLWHMTESVVGSRAQETITVLLASAMLQRNFEPTSVTKDATTLALAAHGMFASLCVTGGLASHGYLGPVTPSSVPAPLACSAMSDFLSSCVSNAVSAARGGVDAHTAYLAALVGGVGAQDAFLDRSVGPGLPHLARPEIAASAADALTRALFGPGAVAMVEAGAAQGTVDGALLGHGQSAGAGAAAGVVGDVPLTERAATTARVMLALSAAGADSTGEAAGKLAVLWTE